jgi:AraC-like DNA-binding protein
MVWLLDFLAAGGLDADAIATQHELSPTDLLNPDLPVTAAQHRGVLATALSASGDTGLGLAIGRHRAIATLDQLAYLMMSSASLRESTEAGLRYQNYSGRFSGNDIVTTFSEAGEEACYAIHAKHSLGELRLLATEDLLACIVTTSRWVLGRPLPVTRLLCDYPPPPHADRYQDIFSCDIRFNAPTTSLFFDAAVLDEPLPQSSPQSARLYARLCEEKSIARNQGDVAWRVWQLVVQEPAHPPTLEDISDQLHMSVRTLTRKLRNQGWTYQRLIDEVREIHARRYLSDPTRPISAIAQILGYADSSGFHRAFKKWTGLSPKSYRENLFPR